MALPIGLERVGAYAPLTGEAALAAAQQKIAKLETDLESQQRKTEVLERTIEGMRQQLQLLGEPLTSSRVTTELRGEVGELAAKVERITRGGYVLHQVLWQNGLRRRPPHPPVITFNLNLYEVPVEAREILLELTTQYPSGEQHDSLSSTISGEGFTKAVPLPLPSTQVWIPVSPARTFTMTFPVSGTWSSVSMVKIIAYR